MTPDAPHDPRAAVPDRYELYEQCVQSSTTTVRLLRAIHGGDPRVLAEDFCGTAAVSATWVRTVHEGRAIVVDADAEPLERVPRTPTIDVRHGDVVAATIGASAHADVVWVGNFSIGEWHERPALLAYLRHVRTRLRSGGVLVCDLYGGESALVPGAVTRDHVLADGRSVSYTWEQRDVDHLTGLVTNAMHFRVERAGRVEVERRDAFVYRWRHWSIAELRDAMREVGFAATAVYPDEPDAVDDTGISYVLPLEHSAQLDETFVALVAARTPLGPGG